MVVALGTIFLLLFCGFWARRSGLMAANQSVVLVDFVLCFALPALVFDAIYHAQLGWELAKIVLSGIIASTISAALACAVGLILRFSKPSVISMGILAFFGNTLFIGLPVVSGAFGPEAAASVILYDEGATGIPFAVVAPLVLSLAAGVKSTVAQNALKVVKFPPFIALVLGLVLRAVELPEGLFAPLKVLGAATVPCALFAVGMGLGFGSIKSAWGKALLVLGCKMAVAPAVFAAVAGGIFGASIAGEWRMGMILSAMPPMVLAAVMIMKAGLDSSLAAACVAMGTVGVVLVAMMI